MFHIKIYFQSFVSIYHVYHLFWIINKNILYISNITLNYCLISETNIWVTLSENTIPSCMICQTYCFSFLTLIATFQVTTCIFKLKCFNCSSYLVPPFCSVILLGDIILKSWSDIATNCHKIISRALVTILISLFTHFDFDPVLSHYITNYYTHSFLLP